MAWQVGQGAELESLRALGDRIAFVHANNFSVAVNVLGWLAREEALIQIRGRDPLSQPVVLSDEQKEVLGWGAVLGWPLLVGSLALGVMLRHRRRGSGEA